MFVGSSRNNPKKMNTSITFAVGQKVERKGKFYFVSEVNFTPSANSGFAGDLVGVRSINKKTGKAWQFTMYFLASEVFPA